MEPEFWHQRWKDNQIGFHRNDPNPILVNYFDALPLEAGSRIFIPLCGKTRDISWLLSKGHRIVGIELSPIAIGQLFEDLGVEPEISVSGKLKHYKGPDIDIFQGDFFDLSKEQLGSVDAVYDRGALVALPGDMRFQYTEHLSHITEQAQQLLITYYYDKSLGEGPPFSISNEELRDHYGERSCMSLLTTLNVEGGVNGIEPCQQKVWII